jgi:hypothetical protein
VSALHVWIVAAAICAVPSPATAAPVDAMGRFVGTWESAGTFTDSAYSKAGSVSGSTTCGWSIDHDFLICQQRVVLGKTEQHGIAIYTYDPAAEKYRFYNVGATQVGSTAIAVDPTTITYTDTYSDGGKTVTNRTLNVWDDPDHYHFSTEYSLDGGAHCTTILSGTAHRTHP